MKKLQITGFLLVFAVVTGCGQSANPESLAKKIGSLYRESMVKLAGIVKGQPEAEKVEVKIKKLKEEMIQKFVKVGKLREKLSKEDKKKTNWKLWSVNSKLRKEDTEFDASWKLMNKSQQLYREDGNYKLSRLISSFNIIQQYAQFELLRRQVSKDAKRLGVDK